MKLFNSFLIAISFMVVLFVDVAATRRSPKKNDYVNLQVLPKEISSKELQHIMVDEFQDGLGVGCGYCHVPQKGSLLLDYASDEKPEKEIARKMMRMTLDINNNHFGVEKAEIGNGLMPVTCITCHRGTPHPVNE